MKGIHAMADQKDHQIIAMIKQCGRRGGSCNCEKSLLGCKAKAFIESSLQDVFHSEVYLADRRRALLEHLKRLDSPLGVIREGWEPPEPPDGYELVACLDGDEWHLCFVSEDDDVIDGPTGDQSWPFVADRAYGEDWEKIGIRWEMV